MPSLLIFEGAYYSQLDEDAFYRWLGSIAGVRNITGTPDGLVVGLRSKNLREPALRDLIAIHWRYRLPMKDLREFKSAKNESWFRNPMGYWFEAVFGEKAVPANMELSDMNRASTPDHGRHCGVCGPGRVEVDQFIDGLGPRSLS